MSRAAAPQAAGEPPVVVAQSLTKIFKDFWMRDRARAVDGVDFEIHRGEVFGLLGPNGSGKSTSIKMILGLLKRTRGRLSVFGKAPTDVSIKERIGYLPEESYLYPFLNARETLDYYGKLFQIPYKQRIRRIDELLEMVGLTGVQHRQIREYSKGMQRRIGLAQALINDPEFLILDEPTTGLDPIGTRQVKDLIVMLGERGKTILLSSHLLTDVEDVVDRMVILYGGRIRAEGSCDDLLTSDSKNLIETDALDQETIDEIRAVLERRHHRLAGVTRPRQRLEELFVSIVEQAREEKATTSGADNSGSTAAFLRGEETESETDGDALIEQLMSAPAGGPDVEAPPAAVTHDAPDEEHDQVIEELIDQGSAPEETPKTTKPAADAEPDAVDEDVIRSLLGNSDDNDDGTENEKS
ncbi:MAG: ABC transporter ATP-binding protein [Phycisphaerales bacterium]